MLFVAKHLFVPPELFHPFETSWYSGYRIRGESEEMLRLLFGVGICLGFSDVQVSQQIINKYFPSLNPIP